ncbi:outer membrane protein [Modicisalibacter ilicicola DSM 19980]|uniref:Outer membrane protein n=1 Tax=Modicisalibacter ilicicola DSM 19980 TaxID=1121942 RepID=A0A1M4SZI3_9GAMM|nr:TolC family outer membrane protein [Halomonas ilicicola]SHE37583.1 outer membrane protein [Halomonas ilicicola DSM 19980]
MPSQGSSSRPRPVPGAWDRKLLPLLVAAALAAPVQAADLLTITRDALDNSAELASSRSVFASVEEGRNVQRGDLLPQVGATASLAHNRTYEQSTFAGDIGTESSVQSTSGGGSTSAGVGEDNYNTTSVGLEATQALFDATNWFELQRAEEEIDQQAFSLEATRQQLLFDVSEAYFEILRAYDVLEARIAQERAIGRQLEQAREQFEVGLIAITDVQEARAAADLARAERIAAQSDLQVSFEALERLTGKRYESIEGLADELPIESPIPSSRSAWVSLAMENNPTLLATQAAIDVANRDVDIAQSGHLPTLDAFARYDYSDVDYLDGNNSASQVGLTANWPLFTGGRTSAQVDQATYLLESSQYDFESQRRETVRQVRSLLTQVKNDVAAVEARRQAIVSNRSALEATRSGYEVGTRNIVDVLDAEQSLYNALADYAEARYTYVIDILALRRESGILDVRDIRALNEWLREESEVHLELPEDENYDAVMDIGEPPTPPQSR